MCRAPLTANIAIVGGSISGLACAYALGRSGHSVHVFEKCPQRHSRSAGIRVPPNMQKLFVEWGIEKELEKASVARRSDMYGMADDEYQGFLHWQADVLREAGGEFSTMRWDELVRLIDRSRSIRRGKDHRPVLEFADRTTYTSDVVVGADGSKSRLREIVDRHMHVSDVPRHHNRVDIAVYSIIVPVEKLERDPDFRKRIDAGRFTVWMGDRKWLIGYPVKKSTEYSIHAYFYGEEVEDFDGWSCTVPTSNIDFTGCHEMFPRIFSESPTALKSKYIDTHVEDWVDASGRIVLVGEAAHPTKPCCIHSASLVTEDAVVLGTLFERLAHREQIPQLLEAFWELRQNRCHIVHTSELASSTMLSLPPGEDREARDANFRLSSMEETWDEDKLLEQWDVIAAVFGYHARESAEDWWIKWGKLDPRALTVPMNLPVTLEIRQE
ncbi:uncharacterized protein EV420DRAFT_1643507 [Desarmillaria tabescens]|uniref:FAD/NAD(P)-binding domain-containing protein n=1 Tax=Armillaria tabescens TaxID=1929756 RepID=A0AA39KF53_ARMTA|nr:uncharacterized protein EV420DRAFT_1643507 [Desarmillaria tabescens]KAK0457648.1 hypothetical protein EV420DRAFT_1643507 [Desarmillaria tabescens]